MCLDICRVVQYRGGPDSEANIHLTPACPTDASPVGGAAVSMPNFGGTHIVTVTGAPEAPDLHELHDGRWLGMDSFLSIMPGAHAIHAQWGGPVASAVGDSLSQAAQLKFNSVLTV